MRLFYRLPTADGNATDNHKNTENIHFNFASTIPIFYGECSFIKFVTKLIWIVNGVTGFYTHRDS